MKAGLTRAAGAAAAAVPTTAPCSRLEAGPDPARPAAGRYSYEAEPPRAAGADPGKIEGWNFTKIPVKDGTGKTVEVDKPVKPYNLT